MTERDRIILNKIFFAGSIAVFSIFFLLYKIRPEAVWGNHFKCIFKQITGLPCVLCGGTASIILILHGNIKAAFNANPLSVLLFFCATVSFIASFICLVTDSTKIWHIIPWKLFFYLLIIASGLSWTYKIYETIHSGTL